MDLEHVNRSQLYDVSTFQQSLTIRLDSSNFLSTPFLRNWLIEQIVMVRTKKNAYKQQQSQISYTNIFSSSLAFNEFYTDKSYYSLFLLTIYFFSTLDIACQMMMATKKMPNDRILLKIVFYLIPIQKIQYIDPIHEQ